MVTPENSEYGEAPSDPDSPPRHPRWADFRRLHKEMSSDWGYKVQVYGGFGVGTLILLWLAFDKYVLSQF